MISVVWTHVCLWPLVTPCEGSLFSSPSLPFSSSFGIRANTFPLVNLWITKVGPSSLHLLWLWSAAIAASVLIIFLRHGTPIPTFLTYNLYHRSRSAIDLLNHSPNLFLQQLLSLPNVKHIWPPSGSKITCNHNHNQPSICPYNWIISYHKGLARTLA